MVPDDKEEKELALVSACRHPTLNSIDSDKIKATHDSGSHKSDLRIKQAFLGFNCLPTLLEGAENTSFFERASFSPPRVGMFGALCKETLEELDLSDELTSLEAMEPRTALLAYVQDVRTELSALTAAVENMSALDKYGYELSDVDPKLVAAAHEKAIGDYDRSCSWDVNSDRPMSSIPKGKLLRGRWVDVVKVIEGALGVKSRWTPKGFQEWLDAMTDHSSPTATMIAHRVQEIIGMQKDWTKFCFDISYAFFQSDYMSEEKELWVELPPELQPLNN